MDWLAIHIEIKVAKILVDYTDLCPLFLVLIQILIGLNLCKR